jgi:hypothetical protein
MTLPKSEVGAAADFLLRPHCTVKRSPYSWVPIDLTTEAENPYLQWRKISRNGSVISG